MTLDEKLESYARLIGISPAGFTVLNVAFRAGAAAMAELFAAGQGMRLGEAPRDYAVTYKPYMLIADGMANADLPSEPSRQVFEMQTKIELAYSRAEAIDQVRSALQQDGQGMLLVRCIPAPPSQT